jgi:hypothetical protein
MAPACASTSRRQGAHRRGDQSPAHRTASFGRRPCGTTSLDFSVSRHRPRQMGRGGRPAPARCRPPGRMRQASGPPANFDGRKTVAESPRKGEWVDIPRRAERSSYGSPSTNHGQGAGRAEKAGPGMTR